jgi:hypothetical protein
VVVDGAGEQWWTTAFAVEQLRVRRHCLGDWVRRSKQAGHVPGADPDECPRCRSHPNGFPHVDPPARAGSVAGYRAEQLMSAEAYTASSTRTGRLRAEL